LHIFVRETLLSPANSEFDVIWVAVMVVGALIFVLGIDLVKEALWDTRHRVSTCVYIGYSVCFTPCVHKATNRSEYVTIASIMVVMTAWDFVIGVLFGIVVSCMLPPALHKRCDLLMCLAI
jgi:sulfate permease, SulP family